VSWVGGGGTGGEVKGYLFEGAGVQVPRLQGLGCRVDVQGENGHCYHHVA
jgi:hypothetical protein